MILHLTELTDKSEIRHLYEIYRHCMYMPTKEKFYKKAADFQNDSAVRIFACFRHERIAGVVVLSLAEHNRAEIIGIAVEPSHRNQGIGSFLLHQVRERLQITSLYAETDHDAVRFYQRNGFIITAFPACYNGEIVTRYRCEWNQSIIS